MLSLFSKPFARILSVAALTTCAANVVANEVTWVETTSKLVPNYQAIEAEIEAINESTVTAQVSGKVKAIYVDVDDQVAAGQLLLEIDDTVLKAQLAEATAAKKAAEAQFQAAKIEFERLNNLRQQSFVSQTQLTQAQSAMDVAKANVQVSEAQIQRISELIGFSRIEAPYSGVVLARHIEVGETALVGQPLLTGFALNQNRIVSHIPNGLVRHLELAKSALYLQVAERWLPISPVTLSPNADPVTRTVMARANIDASTIAQRPGSFLKAAIKTGDRSALVVPSSAVFRQGDLTAVYVSFNQDYALRQVRVGQVLDGEIEVISGLKEGEKVALNPAQLVSANRKGQE